MPHRCRAAGEASHWRRPLRGGRAEARKGVLGQRGRGSLGKGGRHENTVQACGGLKGFAFYITWKTRWQVEKGEWKM